MKITFLPTHPNIKRDPLEGPYDVPFTDRRPIVVGVAPLWPSKTHS